MSDSVWHEGELEVQRRAGVASEAGELQGMVRPGMAPPLAVFLSQRQFAVLGTLDASDRVWASVVVGDIGFIRALDPYTVEIAGGWATTDPLLENIMHDSHVGMLAIDFNNRRRVRINGTAERSDGILRIHAEQVYSNCPKYIQARIPGELSAVAATTPVVAARLTPDQQEWISRADTFFIASAHPQRGVDASHRGGNPGFIHAESGSHLVIPDYSGNNLFNTLGNIQMNPKAGLLFLDFETGRTLQLTGRATINWDERARTGFAGAQRLLEFNIEEVRETQNGAPLRFEFRTYSPFNPALDQ
jgi:predicted pyridoxine 5'-phosphate oxidase superfamily flavin-nucleotide-binding protein